MNTAPLGFEGPEKRLEIDFKFLTNDRPLGLRAISQDQWQQMLSLAKCTIISCKSNDDFDSYVLSESSLFVFPTKIMIKTCGTTVLLNTIPKILEYANECELQTEFVMFSRKNFLFPSEQNYPHSDWQSEVEVLNKTFDGTAYVLGPLTKEHWYLYIADYHDHTEEARSETTLEIMMHQLDRECAERFYKRKGTADDEKFPGIADLLPGSETDEFNFTPCGYSMNGLRGNDYYTIHVTPEPQCSYASFETNANCNYAKLVTQVTNIFGPGSFTLTFFREKKGPRVDNFNSFEIPGYHLTHKTFSELEGNCDILLCNYEARERVHKKPRIPPSSTSIQPIHFE